MKTVLASAIHERFWLQAELDGANSAYNVALVHYIEGLLDCEALQRAYDALVTHHEILRATFHDTPEGLTLQVHDALPSTIQRQRVDPEEFEQTQEAFIARLHLAPFDLSKGPLLRAGVLSAGPDKHLLVSVVHHVALDGAAIPILFRQLGEAYGCACEGAPMPRWTPSVLHSAEAPGDERAALDYWREAFRAETFHSALPTLPASAGDRSATVLFDLPEALEKALRDAAKAREASFFETMAAAWAAFVHRFSGEAVVSFGYPVSLRPRDAAEHLGCFVNTLPMTLEVEGASFDTLIAQASEARRGASAHQHLTWERIVDGLRTEGRLGADTPTMNVGLAMTHLRHQPLSLGALQVEPLAPPPVRAIWEFLLELEIGAPTRMRLCGREDRFPLWLLHALKGQLLTFLETLVKAPEAPISSLGMLDETQRLHLLAHGQGRDLDPAAEGTLSERFALMASEHPDAVAIQTGSEGMSYWALDIRSNRTAHALLALIGDTPKAGARVGLLFERSAEAVVAMVAVIKLGLTYVPLRATDPVTRWRDQLASAGALALVGHSHLLEQLEEEVSLPLFRSDAPGSLSGHSDAPVASDATPESAAYLMFTSGSTGKPKGVIVPHRGVMRLACGGGPHALSVQDSVGHGASLGFDLSVWEIWGTLLTGARLVVLSRADMLDTERLAEQIATHGLTSLGLATPLLHAHVDAKPEAFSGLRLLIAGGDVLEPGPVDALLSLPSRPITQILNGYGPTENTVFSTFARVRPANAQEAIPIGRPVAGSTCFVMDDAGRQVPVGFPGELWIGGEGLALGYDGLDDETKSRFLNAPESLNLGAQKLYRTGDRVRWRADGQLDFFGRLDQQIKIRGQRLEPAEVSAQAIGHPDILQAVTVVDREADPELVLAYTIGPRSRLSDEALMQHLRERLPPHALPNRRVRVGALPLNLNGKVDTKAILAVAPPVAKVSLERVPPSGAREETLVALWSKHLPVSELGVLDRFVDLGGDSLRAVRLVAAIRDALGEELSVADIYRLGTIRAMASELGHEEGPLATVTPLFQASSEGPRPRHVPLGMAQMSHWHLLRRGMSYACPCVLHIGVRIDAEAFVEAWDDVLARHELPWMQIDLERPQMRRVDSRMCNVLRMDLPRLAPDAAEYQVLSRVRRAINEPFVNRSPMFTMLLAQAHYASWYFAFIAPHALVDGHTLKLLIQELHDTYLARLDGAHLSLPAPMSLFDYAAWEKARMTDAKIEESIRHYEATQEGDASWTVPTSHLQDEMHAAEAILNPEAIERLSNLARELGVSLEATLTYCTFLTLHGVHKTPLVRCLSAYHNREEEVLERLPLMMAGAMYHQSQLEREQAFSAGLAAFGARYVSAFSHARLPPLVLFGMSRQLFMRGSLRHYALSRLCAALWGLVSAKPRVVLTYTVDLVISSARYALERRLTRWLRRKRTRTVGCMITISTPLSAHEALGSERLPMRRVRTPVDVPEAIPGDPLLELHRDAEGIKGLFQARYKPHAVKALASAFESVVARAAATPEGPLGTLIDETQGFAEAFERLEDEN